MSPPLLTASMIVCNEERFLEGCLRSIMDVVDELVIVDTGSTDRSREIAKSFGAKVFYFQWCGDFSAARNKALDYSNGEWILYIDADERLGNIDRQQTEQLLRDSSKVAYTVRLRPQTGYTSYKEHRLYRNDHRIRFRGVIHEKVMPSIIEVAAADGVSVGDSEIELTHLGYDDNQHHKHLRNLPLLRDQLNKDPYKVFNWRHLGNVLAGLGDDDGACAAWLRGIELVREKKEFTGEDSLPYIEMLRWKFEHGQDITDLLDEALDLFPYNHLLLWNKSRNMMRNKEFAGAIELLNQLVEIDGDTFYDEQIAYDSRIFGVLAYEALGDCHFHMENYATSAEFYALAVACEPDSMECQVKRQLALGRYNLA